jgi:transcriptional regulator with XRE-family HTH domain
MMKLEDIRGLLQDRRISIVAEATGIHFNTIREIRDNENANPTYRVMTKLADYLDSNNGRLN